MSATHAVGIDLGTTYSVVASLNERGEPVTIPNEEGELSTPSVVMIENGEEVVGTEALRNAIMYPANVVQNAKRFIGDGRKTWNIEGRTYTPIQISAAVVRKLLRDAQRQIGKVERAVITVPAQFSDAQRQATIQAGRLAGLKQVDIINEPVAAALCYVLGKEGLWFSELAEEQTILVYDLGGGTFDLSLVRYHQNEVKVIASTGDLHLGGIDWNQALLNAVAEQFAYEFSIDPRKDPESLQALSWEVEQCKRSLTNRPRASLIVQHGGKRKTYQVEQEQFNQITSHLVKRTEDITRQLLKDNKMGWARVNVVLSTGGSSRMPMIKSKLSEMAGRTLNQSLSPDMAIAHGAAYYAGMLLTNNEFAQSILSNEASERLRKVTQQSVTARGLGILIRDHKTNTRVPYYMIPANTPLPASASHVFGTAAGNQKRVVLRIVESGSRPELPYAELGECRIDGLPRDLPIDSAVEVTISYDKSAVVHVSAIDKTSGKAAKAEIVRQENLVTRESPEADEEDEVHFEPVRPSSQQSTEMPVVVADESDEEIPVLPPVMTPPPAPPQRPSVRPMPPAAQTPAAAPTPKPAPPSRPSSRLEEAARPVLLCDDCGEPLDPRGTCRACAARPKTPARKPVAPAKPQPTAKPQAVAKPQPTAKPSAGGKPQTPGKPQVRSTPLPPQISKPKSPPLPTPSEILEPDDSEIIELQKPKPKPKNPGR